MSKADRLARALDRLLAASPEVEAAAVVSADGLPMASALPSHVAEDRLAAMSAALLTLGDRASEGLGKGVLQQVFIEGSDGHVILMSAGRDAVLVAVIERGAKIGLVLFEVRRTAAEVAETMEGASVAGDPPDEPTSHREAASIVSVPEAVETRTERETYYSDPPRRVAPPEPVPAAEVVQPTVNAWE